MAHYLKLAVSKVQTLTIEITQRLPAHIQDPCLIHCDYVIEAEQDYFLLKTSVHAELKIHCQRCLQDFTHAYQEDIMHALCHSQSRAEQLMPLYDSVIVEDKELDLMALLTDDLHLLTPKAHENLNDCDKNVAKLIGSINI